MGEANFYYFTCLKFPFGNEVKKKYKHAAFRARILGCSHRRRYWARIRRVFEKSCLPTGRNWRSGEPNPQFERIPAHRGRTSVGLRSRRVGHHRDDQPSLRWQSQGTNVQSGEAREEKEEDRQGQKKNPIQQKIRQRRRHFRQEEGTQLQQLNPYLLTSNLEIPSTETARIVDIKEEFLRSLCLTSFCSLSCCYLLRRVFAYRCSALLEKLASKIFEM